MGNHISTNCIKPVIDSKQSLPNNNQEIIITKKTSKFKEVNNAEMFFQIHLEDQIRNQALQYSSQNNISYDDACLKINPNYDKWKKVKFESNDLEIGDLIVSQKVIICCHYLNKPELKYETVGFHYDEKDEGKQLEPGEESEHIKSVVSCQKKESKFLSHYGTKYSVYGIEHKIEPKRNFKKGFIFTYCGNDTQADKIHKLNCTDPIIEVRTQDGNKLKRYIMAQDFSEGGNCSSCNHILITHQDGLYKVEICRNFH